MRLFKGDCIEEEKSLKCGKLQEFVQNMFMGSFIKLGKIINLNRRSNMWLINKIFKKSGDGDRRDIVQYPAGFINVEEPYDKENHAAIAIFAITVLLAIKTLLQTDMKLRSMIEAFL